MARRPAPKPKPRPARPTGDADAPLTPRQARFVEEYLVDLNATQAAIRAGYARSGADVEGARQLGNARIAAAVAAGVAARSERTQITQDDVLRRFWQLATADPNALIEMRRTCCRYCHGEAHRFQRTRGEMENARAAWAHRTKKAKDDDEAEPFDEQGGEGYDARKAPHPECPECFGEGVERPFPKDTRHLPPEALVLYAGVRVTKDGLEVKMHDQSAALVNVAKHLGMFVEKHDVNATVEHRDAPRQTWQVGDRVISWN